MPSSTPLTREVAYASQLTDKRRRTHGAVARALEAEIGAAEASEHAALVAHHFEEADEVEPAIRWHRHAAEWASRSNALRAFEHSRRAFELAERLPPSAERDAVEIHEGQRVLFFGSRVGMPPEEIARARDRAVAAARRAGDTAGLAGFESMGVFDQGYRTGRFADLLPELERAFAVVEASGDLRWQVIVGSSLAGAQSFSGRTAQSLATNRRLTALCVTHPELLADDLTRWPGLMAWAVWIVCANALGRFSEIAEVTSELREVSRREGSALAALFLSSSESVESGYRDPRAAIAQLVRLLEPARELMPFFMTALQQALAINQLRVGEFAAAVASIEPLLGLTPLEVMIRGYLALALAGAGDAPRALAEAQKAVALAEERGLPRGTPEAFVALARATLLADGAASRDAVERALARAEAVVAEQGLLPDGCEILQARAALARALGDEAARARFLIEAERRFTEMGAPGYAALIAQERAK